MQSDSQGGESIRAKGIGGSRGNRADVGVEVVDTAGADVGDVHERGGRQDVLAATRHGKGLLAEASGDGEDVGSSRGTEALRVATRGNGKSASGLEESDGVDDVVHVLPAVGNTLKVVAAGVVGRVVRGGVGSITVESLQVTAVPVDNLLVLDVRGNIGVSVLVGGNEGLGQIEPTIVSHVIGPLGVTIVGVLGAEGSDVVRLAIVVPGDDLDHGKALLDDLLPSVEDERAAREDPVLAVGDLGTVVSREPGRDGSKVGLATEPVQIAAVSLSNRNVGARSRGLVVAVVIPGHPVESTVKSRGGRLAGVEVGNEVDVSTGSRTDGVGIEAIASKGGSKNTAIDLELSRLVGVLSNLLTNASSVARTPPVEVEGDEDLHAIVGGRLVSITKLLISVTVGTNVQSKSIDTGSLCTLHISIVVGRTCAIRNDTNLPRISFTFAIQARL